MLVIKDMLQYSTLDLNINYKCKVQAYDLHLRD